ncbi:hypothetical protein GQR58_018047 [Nymphon striatum]|nr:hypothetical protein GQR58_018047 [Nymphon striatum]
MQFVVGVGLDRIGPRLTTSVMLGVAGTGGGLLFAYAQSPQMIIIAMALIGIGCAPILMASLYIFAHAFSPARFALLTAIFVGVGNLGNVIGTSPLASASEAFGWRSVMFGLAGVTFLVAAAIFFFVRDPVTEQQGKAASFSGYFQLLKLKPLWFIFGMMLINYSVSAGIRGLWIGPYLSDVYGADTALIGQISLFMALAMIAGIFLYGPLDTILNTRKWIVVGGSSIMIVMLSLMAIYSTSDIWFATSAIIFIGIAGGGYSIVMAHSKSYFEPHLIGRGVTLMNFFSIGGAGLMQFFTGKVVENYTLADKPEAAYSALAYNSMEICFATPTVHEFS